MSTRGFDVFVSLDNVLFHLVCYFSERKREGLTCVSQFDTSSSVA